MTDNGTDYLAYTHGERVPHRTLSSPEMLVQRAFAVYQAWRAGDPECYRGELLDFRAELDLLERSEPSFPTHVAQRQGVYTGRKSSRVN